MKFSVNAAALPGLAQLLDRRHQDLTDGLFYLHHNTHVEAGQAGILNWLLGEHRQVVAGVGAFLGRAGDGYAGPYATAIDRAAGYYGHTDATAAARLDATMAPPDDPGKHTPEAGQADPTLAATAFADPVCPGTNYQPPADHQAEYRYDFTPMDSMSPTSNVRELIWQVSAIAVDFGLLDHPYDVIDEAVKPFSGDWAAFAGCADVFSHLAAAVTDNGGCVQAGMRTLPRVWTGNAADACTAGLAGFAGTLLSAGPPLRDTSGAYRSAAEQIRAQAELLAALLTILIDEAVEAAIDAASGGMFEEAQVATTIEDIVDTVLKLRRVVAAAWDIAHSFAANGQVSTRNLGVIGNSHPLPALTGSLPDLPG
jgi:hypothetical protein